MGAIGMEYNRMVSLEAEHLFALLDLALELDVHDKSRFEPFWAALTAACDALPGDLKDKPFGPPGRTTTPAKLLAGLKEAKP